MAAARSAHYPRLTERHLPAHHLQPPPPRASTRRWASTRAWATASRTRRPWRRRWQRRGSWRDGGQGHRGGCCLEWGVCLYNQHRSACRDWWRLSTAGWQLQLRLLELAERHADRLLKVEAGVSKFFNLCSDLSLSSPAATSEVTGYKTQHHCLMRPTMSHQWSSLKQTCELQCILSSAHPLPQLWNPMHHRPHVGHVPQFYHQIILNDNPQNIP